MSVSDKDREIHHFYLEGQYWQAVNRLGVSETSAVICMCGIIWNGDCFEHHLSLKDLWVPQQVDGTNASSPVPAKSALDQLIFLLLSFKFL